MTKAELIQSIYDAFHDVKLGDGIGLWEARMIDDAYEENSPEYIKVRNEDEREDWTKLLPIFYNQDKIENYITDTWSFMDDKGILFHLPCFLLQDIEPRSENDNLLWDNPLIYTLAYDYKDAGSLYSSIDRLKILNATQQNTVLKFLDYKIQQFLKEKKEEERIKYQTAKDNFIKYIANPA